MADDVRKFKLKRKSVPVVMEDENGNEFACELREMTGAERDQWLNGMAGRMRVDAQGNPVGVAKFDGLQADLIALCLYQADTRVPKSQIVGYPASVQTELFKICQEINSLGDKAREEAKNG